jgi:N6-adenosine-specific RNA methylase IME4
MDFDAACDFAIDAFAAPDCILLFWSTAASLVDDIEILAEWGFVALRPRDAAGRILRGEDGKRLPAAGRGLYGSHQVWRKRRAGNMLGMGRWFRDQHELLIVARRGKPPAPLPGTQAESVFDAPIGPHSAKPGDVVRGWIDRCWPHLEKVEVFARGEAPVGWRFWGNQASDRGSVIEEGAELHRLADDGCPHDGETRRSAPAPAKPKPGPVDDDLDIPAFLRRGHPDCVVQGDGGAG